MLKGYYYTPIKDKKSNFLGEKGRRVLERLYSSEMWNELEFYYNAIPENSLTSEQIKDLNLMGSKFENEDELEELIERFLYHILEFDEKFIDRYGSPIKAFKIWHYIFEVKNELP